MIMMRPAMLSDADDLLKWRNDPQTLAASRSTEPVPAGEHAQWMRFSVAQGYPQHIVMIATDSDFGDLGVIKFDGVSPDLMTYEVGITVAPPYRGRGLGVEMLSLACRVMQDYALLAEIRAENLASRRIFEHCGFRKTGGRKGFVNYRREPS